MKEKELAGAEWFNSMQLIDTQVYKANRTGNLDLTLIATILIRQRNCLFPRRSAILDSCSSMALLKKLSHEQDIVRALKDSLTWVGMLHTIFIQYQIR